MLTKKYKTAKKDIYILGAGGMAREVFDIYKTIGHEGKIKGFLIDKQSATGEIKNLKVLTAIPQIDSRINFIGAIGNPLRKNFIRKLEKLGGKFETIIDPSSRIGEEVKYGRGNIFCSNSVLTENITIGNHVIINVGSTINHDCKIEDFVTIGPGVHIAGRVSIGEGSFVGIGAVIKEGINIGKNVFIGAGSVVVGDIPDNVLVYGSPARFIKKIRKGDWEELI